MNERTTVRSKKPPASANTSAQSHLLRRRCACGGTPGLDGECAGCRKERLSRQHRGQTDHDGPSTVPPIVNEVLRSPGQPLDADTRASMESRFGHDFGRVRVYNSLPRTVPVNLTVGPTNDVHEREADAAASRVAAATAMPGKRFADFGGVRVHTDSRAAESARALDARAYTLGHHIVFDEGRYASRTNEGRGLLAHELTHVLQQTGPATGILQRNPDDKEKPEEKPAAKFAGCDADQQGKIGEAIKQADGLAVRAVQAFEREFPLSYEMAAMKSHFGSLGSDQKSTIIDRYKHIQANLGSKTYTCAKKGKKVKAGKKVVDLCGEASCPGSEITLFPDFGKEVCPAGPVIFHEAAHNAGACDDIDTGKGYPPADAENNAYSYEYFALALAAGYKTPELGKHKPKAPRISD
jgi:hypothetical protein